MANVQYRGTGRRKSSVARVILTPGTGKCEINGKAAKEYLPSDVLLMIVDQPFILPPTLTLILLVSEQHVDVHYQHKQIISYLVFYLKCYVVTYL